MNRREFIALLGVGAAATLRAEDRPVRPVDLSFDVCIVGGSCTGVFAAIRAAEAGLSVALVENNAFFGGTATAGLVPVWHSLFSTDNKTRVAGGLT